MERKIEYLIDEKSNNKTVENFLRNSHGFSSRIIRMLKQEPDGLMKNNEHTRTIDVLSCGDVLTVTIPPDEKPIPPSDLPIEIAYEDEDVIVLNKSPFMPVHPTRNHQGDTLANALSGYLNKKGLAGTFRAINRLDRDTSGLVVVALNQYSACRLSQNVDKEYYAVVHGVLEGSSTIYLPIRRKDALKIHREVHADGERAVTHWSALSGDEDKTLLRIILETGRTHQIRVHFSHLGYPLVGENLYCESDNLMLRQALHCKKVKFTSPVSGKEVTVESEFPDDIKKIIKNFK